MCGLAETVLQIAPNLVGFRRIISNALRIRAVASSFINFGLEIRLRVD